MENTIHAKVISQSENIRNKYLDGRKKFYAEDKPVRA